MARRRASASERLALSLGFTISRGRKHGKVFDSGGKMIAVYPLSRSRDWGAHWNNYRAALMRAAKEQPK